VALLVVFVVHSAAYADDQPKAEKELRKITAMAADPAARPLVAQTVAEFLKVPRVELARQRQAVNLSYGSVFLIYRAQSGETNWETISAQLHAGKTIWEIGNEHHADWRQIASDAKKLNEKIEAAFYNFFKEGRPEAARGANDGYDAAKDSVAADQEGLTKQDIAAAQDTYLRCFRRARGGDSAPAGPDERSHTPPSAEGDPR